MSSRLPRLPWAAAFASVALVGALVAVAATVGGDGEDAAASSMTKRETTAEVTRRDLVVRERFDGTLSYADTRTVTAPITGTVTAVPHEGSTVKRGQVLYSVDGKPVTLLYGAEPAWRELSVGVERGADVRQLEQNLVALGFDPRGEIRVDGRFDWATRAGVARLEAAHGREQDGVVTLGEIVFLPGAQRIGALKVAVGAAVQAGTEIVETSSTTPIVIVDLEASRQSLVRERDRVQVELPNGKTVDGVIASVGKVAKTEGGSDDDAPGGGGDDEEPTVELEISLGDGAADALDQAPVDVLFEKERKNSVLAVPVSALLALAGGGFAVEVTAAGQSRLVAVELGMSADGYVEVTGKGIREGVQVVTPA